MSGRSLNGHALKFHLGPPSEQILAEDSDTIIAQRQRLAEAENQLQQTQAIAAERDKETQEIQNLRRQIERTQAQIDAVQENWKWNRTGKAEPAEKEIIKPNLKTRKKKLPLLKNKQHIRKKHKQKLTE